jgi:hypothetical protein
MIRDHQKVFKKNSGLNVVLLIEGNPEPGKL